MYILCMFTHTVSPTSPCTMWHCSKEMLSFIWVCNTVFLVDVFTFHSLNSVFSLSHLHSLSELLIHFLESIYTPWPLSKCCFHEDILRIATYIDYSLSKHVLISILLFYIFPCTLVCFIYVNCYLTNQVCKLLEGRWYPILYYLP